MLGKLLKYEIKSTARLFLPFYAAMIVLAGLNRLMSVMLNNIDFLDIPRVLAMTAYVFLIIAAFAMAVVVTIQRFYKNLLGDEGYLTMTLPVSVSSHILCKLITSFMWIVLTIIFTLFSVFLMLPEYGFLKNLPQTFAMLSREFSLKMGISLGSLIGVIAVLAVVAILSMIMIIYTAIAFGHMANKHKLLFSFVAYLAIYTVVQLINLILMSTLGMSLVGDHAMNTIPMNLLWAMAAAEVVYIIGYFFLTRYLLKNKLNLE